MVTGYTHNPFSFCAILHCSLEAREIKIAHSSALPSLILNMVQIVSFLIIIWNQLFLHS